MSRIAKRHNAKITTINDSDGNEVTSVVFGKNKAILGTDYPRYISFVLYAGINNITELTSSDKYAKCVWTQVERFAEKQSKKGKENGSNENQEQR